MIIRCYLPELIIDHDATELFMQTEFSHEEDNSADDAYFKKFDIVGKILAARTYLNKEITRVSKRFKNNITHSAAFVALIEGLFELVKNSSDAHADTISIEIEVKNSHVSITYTDNGTGFSPEFLDHQISLNYVNKLNGLHQLQSSKPSLPDQMGGAGIGLALISRFLTNISLKHKGSLVISNQLKYPSAMITISSSENEEGENLFEQFLDFKKEYGSRRCPSETRASKNESGLILLSPKTPPANFLLEKKEHVSNKTLLPNLTLQETPPGKRRRALSALRIFQREVLSHPESEGIGLERGSSLIASIKVRA